jgi:hypothetical protein
MVTTRRDGTGTLVALVVAILLIVVALVLFGDPQPSTPPTP